MAGGIEIPREIADSEGVPADLDAAAEWQYEVPSPRRRRWAAVAYLAGAAAMAAGVAFGELPLGMWAAVVLGAGLGLWHLVAAWDLKIADAEALETANRAVEFAVGHASAVVGFDGWRSLPIWNVLVFSADDPPTRRALVRVDAVGGEVVEQYEEVISDQ